MGDLDTTAVHAGREAVPSVTRPHAPPIVPAAVHEFEGLGQIDDLYEGRAPGYIYYRNGGPNQAALAAAVAALEGHGAPEPPEGVAAASGMGAIAAVLFALCRAGDHVVAQSDLYGVTRALLEEEGARLGIETTFVDATDAAALEAAFRPTTRLVLVETLSNPLVRVADLEGAARVARARGAALVVDNTFATPIHCRPLARGADVVVHSTAKMLSGHDDVGGGLAVAAPALAARIRATAVRLGPTLSAFDAWLALRGLRTLPLRAERAAANAAELAARLAGHPSVAAVHYPGLPGHAQHARARALLSGGFGAMLAFEVRGGREGADRVLGRLTLIRLAPSLGGVATTTSHPASTSHRPLPADARRALGIGDGLIRLSVGIEGVEDLWRDLESALR
ncbi:MAG TPA: aminotransferase class I/II-fold pyridoxal phosphate-dependent enzyme [Thermodesulfobacteriota bacterium]